MKLLQGQDIGKLLTGLLGGQAAAKPTRKSRKRKAARASPSPRPGPKAEPRPKPAPQAPEPAKPTPEEPWQDVWAIREEDFDSPVVSLKKFIAKLTQK